MTATPLAMPNCTIGIERSAFIYARWRDGRRDRARRGGLPVAADPRRARRSAPARDGSVRGSAWRVLVRPGDAGGGPGHVQVDVLPPPADLARGGRRHQ